jgi:NAD(P)-dependent dehydrogenase (short-subunit alcohol dehydrogenase family)
MNSPMKAIVTGHTHGLGAAITLDLLHRGIPVLGLARSSSSNVEHRFPSLFQQARLWLDDSEALSSWLDTPVLSAFLANCTDAILINNAGSVQPVGPLESQDPAAVASAIALNVAAPLMLAAAVVQATKGKQRRIVHISSGAGRSAYPGWSVYCATKAALDHHARAVALDAQQGVRICSLAPGIVDTAMQAEIRATPEERFPMRQRFVDLQRNGDLASPADAATSIVEYILSNAVGDQPVHDVRG